MTITADRVLSVLQLFTMAEPEWTVDEAARRLNLPNSTAYRYFRSLLNVGLIVDVAAGRYVVGPAVLALDRQARHFDPLLPAAAPVLVELARAVEGPGAALVCRIFRRAVICVDHAAEGAHPGRLGFERGRTLPLFRSAVSKAIAAHLPQRNLRRAFQDEVGATGLEQAWTRFKQEAREIRRRGVARTAGEIDAGLLGLAAPVFSADGQVLASVGLVLERGGISLAQERVLTEQVRMAGETVTAALAAGSETARARAV